MVALTPLVVGVFAWLRRRRKEPSTPSKMAVGMFIAALSTLVMIAATFATNNGTIKGSAMWLVGTYAVITVGELCLSPMGLSMVSKLSPPRLTALMMGAWFLSTSIGRTSCPASCRACSRCSSTSPASTSSTSCSRSRPAA